MLCGKGVGRVVAAGVGILLSLFLALGSTAAEPAPTALREAGARTAYTQSEQRHCLSHRQEGNGAGLVVPGALGVPSPAPRTGSPAEDPVVNAGGHRPATVTAPRTARQAVPLTRSGELPVALGVFRC
ncbi:hypothetical protein ACIP9H_28985 [Streptomyces sp. NPDC088732]|uniref:hypothetical protein n=1 Tax=Streptomyces sp. NPDC088732 TaxID=3365879 RepID=UPI00380F65E1